jgi:hypothetical protein
MTVMDESCRVIPSPSCCLRLPTGLLPAVCRPLSEKTAVSAGGAERPAHRGLGISPDVSTQRALNSACNSVVFLRFGRRVERLGRAVALVRGAVTTSHLRPAARQLERQSAASVTPGPLPVDPDWVDSD